MRRIALFMAGLALLLAAGCAAPRPVAEKSPPPPQPTAPPEPVKSKFQSALDRHGIPMIAPKQGKAILVNIPSYELIALEDGEEVFRSRVIVGAPNPDRETPIIDTVTSVARFLPTWRPTPSMIRTGAYTDGVRPPGRRNPLGLVALRLQPGMLVYLHDTNKPKLFEKDKRALSWGCVRVEGIERLITWTLDMDSAAYQAMTSGRRTTDVPTETLIPVMLRYYTAFPDAAGNLRRYEDVYGRGETILSRGRTPTSNAAPVVRTPGEPVTMEPIAG